MQSKLVNLKSRLKDGHSKVTINTEIYFLAKELGCLPDLLGREYVVEYEEVKLWKFKWHRIKKIIQKPMSIPAFITMMDEMDKDYKNQQKQMKKKGKGRR